MKYPRLASMIIIWFVLSFSFTLSAEKTDSFSFYSPIENLTDVKDLSDFSVDYLGDSSGISILNFSGNYDVSINGSLNIEARQALTQELYSHLSDQYDFLVIFTKFEVDSGEYAAISVSYENDVMGIGKPVFDNSAAMGSQRLQTTIDMTEISDWDMNPSSNGFENTLGALMHEMMHRWGIDVNFIDDAGQVSDLLLGQGEAHWNYFMNTHASIMYGSLWEDLGTGQFQTQSVRKSLSPLDLYLMGFNEPESVPDFYLIKDGVPGERTDIPSLVGSQVSGTRVNISINDIIAAEGPRIPSASNAKHEFNFKFILLKNPNQQAYESDLGKLVVLKKQFQERFFAETSGVGHIVYPENLDPSHASFNPAELPFNPNYAASVDLDLAKSFIVNSQNMPQGYWADKPATKVRDTVLAIKALQLNDDSGGLEAGVNWLNEYEALNNDDLSWQLKSDVLTSAKKQAVINQLVDNINSDGGWGINAGSESSLYDTALVLSALSSSTSSGFIPSSNTKLYVASQINDDFGVGYTSGGVSSLTSSVLLLESSRYLNIESETEQELISYILNYQLPDGGFGTDFATVHETAQVVQALQSTGNSDYNQQISNAVSKLVNLQSVDGTFEGSVYSSALATVVLSNDNRLNIDLVEVKTSNLNPVVGETVIVSFEVKLEADAPLENVEIAVFEQNNLLGSVVIPSLSPEELISENISISTTDLVGNYPLSLKVDPNNIFQESNELDNQYDFNLNVIAQSGTPELAFVYPSINYQPELVSQLPQTIELTFDVINLSTEDLAGVQVGLYKKMDSSLLDLVATRDIDIGSNEIVNVAFDEQITEVFNDTFDFVIVLDSNNQISEVNELNNEHVIEIGKVQNVDLSLSSSEINVPPTIYVGLPVIFEYSLKNTGTIISPTSEIMISVDNGSSVELISTEIISPIDPGSVKELMFELSFDQVGSYDIQFVVDQNNLISEINEANNSGSVTVNVLDNNLPNLSIEGAVIQMSENPGLAGKPVVASVVVSNNSTLSSGPFDLTVYAQKANEAPFEIQSVVGLGDIEGGASRTETINLDVLNFSGPVKIIISVDPNKLIDEFDETDNITFIDYYVLSKADASVSSGGIALNPSVPVVNEPVSVEVIVSNSGEQNITTVDAKIYAINSNTQATTLMASDTLAPLLAGESSLFTFDFVFPPDSDIDQLRVIVDENDSVDESRTDNNSARIYISQQNSDFYINNAFFSPNGDGQKDTVQITFNLDELDNYQISIRNSLSQLVMQYDYSVFTDINFGDVNWDGRGFDGRILPDDQYSIHITGENNFYENELSVILDTNRYSMTETMKNDSGILFDLNCLVNEIYEETLFSSDNKYMYVSSYTDKSYQRKYGIFQIKADGSEIKSMLPNSFTDLNRVNELFLSNSGDLIFKTTNSSNNNDLWKLNPRTLELNQLITGSIERFFVFDFTNDYLTIRHTDNSGNQFNHISLIPSIPTESIQLSPNVQNYRNLLRVHNGWVWSVFDNEEYDVYFKADNDSSNDIFVDKIASPNDLKVSSDKKLLLLNNSIALNLYRINGGLSVATELSEQSINFESVVTLISPDNYVLAVTDTVKLFDQLGTEIVQIDHKFDYDYFVEQITQQYGSIDNLVYNSESGELIYSLNDLEELKFQIDSLKYAWGDSKELYLQFSAVLKGNLFIESYGSYQEVTLYANSSPESKRINFNNISDIAVLDLINTPVEKALISERLNNFFNMGTKVYSKNATNEPNGFSANILDDYRLYSFSPQKASSTVINQIYVKNFNSNSINTCTPVFGNERALYRSKQNLTAFISADVVDGVVALNGSVFDQNLAQYVIEWKRKDLPNSEWNFILSGQNDQVNELFNYWVPSEPGLYSFRLSAYDLADNVVFDEVDVIVGEHAANIKNVVVDPRFISPNFDGVQDELNFEYDLINPVNISIEIKSTSGVVFKTIVRNYEVGMTSDQFSWDGRGDNGQVLPDGMYQVVFEGMTFPLVIDTEKPDVELIVKQVLTESCCFDGKITAQVKVVIPLNGIVRETDQLLTAVEKYDETTDQWREINSEIYVNPFNFENFQNFTLRGRATDKSGNTAYTEIYPVDINKSMPVDIRRVVDFDGETKVYTAALRDNQRIREIGEGEYPQITNADFSDHLGVTIQTKTFQSIRSIEMKTSYPTIVDGNEVIIENTVPLSLAGLDLTQNYFLGDSIVTVNNDPNLFKTARLDGDFYFNFIQINQTDFPDTTEKIRVDMTISYADSEVNHPFIIIFQPRNAFVDTFNTAMFNPAYRGSLLAPQAREHMENVMFGNEGTNDFWFFSDYHQAVSDPKIIVLDTSGLFEVPVAEIELHYEDPSSRYVSQYFKWDGECPDSEKYAFEYQGIGIDGKTVEDRIEPESCGENGIVGIFYDANAFCDNNATVDSTLKVRFSDSPYPDDFQDFPPFKYSIVLEDEAEFEIILYEENNPVIEGDKFNKTYEIDKAELNNGLYKFKHVFENKVTSASGFNITYIRTEYSTYLYIENNKAISEVIKPSVGDKLCAVESMDGLSIPVEFKSTLTTESPFQHSFFQVTEGSLKELTPRVDTLESNVQHEQENDYFKLKRIGSNVSTVLNLNANPEVETTSILHEVTNSTGVSHCTEVELEVDSKLEAQLVVTEESLVDGKLLLSPDGDGVNDSMTYAELLVDEAVIVTVELFRKSDNSLIGTLSSLEMEEGDSVGFAWDGVFNQTIVEDGAYTIKVTYYDDCLISEYEEFSVVVDTKAPLVDFLNPLEGQEIGFITAVEASAVEANLDFVSVEYLFNDVWNPVVTESQLTTTPDLYEITANLNLMGLPQGVYTVKLFAKDLLGFEGETSIDVVLPFEQNIFWNYGLSPYYISPNNDGVQDSTDVNIGLNLQTELTVEVLNINSLVVRQLDFNGIYPSGSHQIQWDGTNESGLVVPDGTYQVHSEAVEVGQPINTETISSHVIIDNTYPSVTYSVTNMAVIKGEGDVNVTVEEMNLQELLISEQSIAPVGVENLVSDALQTGVINVLELDELSEHIHALKTVARDKAGNKTEVGVQFEIDNTLPIVDLIAPIDKEVIVINDTETVNFEGEITEKNFLKYEIFISPNIEPVQWQPIHSSQIISDNKFSYLWTISVVDGDYLVKLAAEDQAGWQSEVIHQIIIDREPPEVLVTQPITNSVIGKNSEILGTVNDANLNYFHLSFQSLPNITSENWQIIYTGVEPIIDSQLYNWSHELESGSYQLKLFAEDKAGLTSEVVIDVIIDSEVPEAALYLEAQLINQQDVDLSWQNSTSSDVVGYWVYRNNVVINESLVTVNSFLDTGLPEGNFTYWVVAEDAIGNLSLPSNNAVINIDTTGPETLLQSPQDGQVVSGTIGVVGTARSTNDFFKYQLYYRLPTEPLPGTLLSQSSIPVTGYLMAEIDTTELSDGSSYVLRLEASDLSLNTNVAERSFLVDNIAPDAPLNLTLQLTGGNDVQLAWNANSEADLAGYLVYRNGAIISGNGTISSSIITNTNFQDVDVVDGTHNYYVVAVDAAGNPSVASNVVMTTIDRRAPDAYFTAPNDDFEFESEIQLKAFSDDDDVVSMLFEFSEDGVNWNTLTEDLSKPFEVIFNPVIYALDYGNIQLRVTATDQSSQVDSTPDQITVIYKDLTPPGVVAGLTGLVTSRDIQLNWTANTEPDLAGYLVSRKSLLPDEEGEYTLLNSSPFLNNEFLDTGLSEGTYLYRIQAIDNDDNQSQWVESEQMTVFSIVLNQPFSPLLTPSVINVNGLSEYEGTVSGVLSHALDTVSLAPVQTDSSGQYQFDDVSPVLGNNIISVSQQVSGGHTSIESSVSTQMSPVPLAPENPIAEVSDFDLNFVWESPDSNTIGYVPYINQQKYTPIDELIDGLSITSSSNSSITNRAIDDNEDSYWSPSYTDRTNGIPVYFQISFDEPRWVTQVNIQWYSFNASNIYQPGQYLLQYQSPVGWITQTDFSGNGNALVNFQSSLPYLTQAIRIWMPLEENEDSSIYLSEIDVFHQPFIGETNYAQTLVDGTYEFQVSAINNYGFESERTAVQSLIVGDVVSPEPVTLTATVQNNNDVNLQWNASTSTDVANYRIYRNGEFIFMTSDAFTLNHQDQNLPNGTISYQVIVVDSAGNISAYSNEVVVEILQQIPDAPTGLVINAVDTGNALNLTWNETSSSDLSNYKLYRTIVSDTGFEVVAVSSTNDYLDEGLINGTRYYYHVTAVDTSGNESSPSEVASGVPFDDIPPVKPVITRPTSSGYPVTVNSLTTDVIGFGSPAVEVDLYQHGSWIDTVLASEQFTETKKDFNRGFNNIRYNRKNSHFAYSDFNVYEVFIVDPDEETFTPLVDGFPRYFFWNNAGDVLYGVTGYYDQSTLRSFGLDGVEIATLLTGFEIREIKVAPDESMILYYGDGINPDNGQEEDGLWLYEIDSQSHLKIDVGASIRLSFDAIEWLPNGNVAFINSINGVYNEGELWLLDTDNGQVQLIDSNTSPQSTLVTNDDGTYIYYVIDVNGNQAVQSHRFSDGIKFSYAKDNIDISMPEVRMNPDILLVNYENYDKMIVNIQSGEVIEYFENVGYRRPVSWLDDGRIMQVSTNTFSFYIPPGLFEFNDVSLDPGLNEFYAVARKANGLNSPESDPIEVTLNEAVLSDLEVKDSYLQLIPSQVYLGESLSGSLLVKNNSQIDVEQARLLIEIIDPSFTTQAIAPAPLDFSLGGGETLLENFTIDNLNSLGEYTVRVFVDSNQQVIETNENNNVVIKVIQVIDDLEADLQIRLNSNSITPGESLEGSLRVYNPGTELIGSVLMKITDVDGYPVGFEESYVLAALNSGDVWEQAFEWDSTDYFAGGYKVEATLYDQRQQVIVVKDETFSVNEDADISISLDTISSQVSMGENMDFVAEIEYLTGNVSQSGTLNWQILNDAQQTVWTSSNSVNSITPGFNGSFNQSWSPTQVGTFVVSLTLDTSLVSSTRTLPFEVIPVEAELNISGAINELTSDVLLGQAWSSIYSIKNEGLIDIVDVPVSLTLWDYELSEMIAQENTAITLNTGNITQLIKGFDTNDLIVNTYVLVLSADLRGYGQSANQLLDTQTFQAVDVTGPEINLINPVNQQFYPADVDLRAAIEDSYSTIDTVEIFLNAVSEISMTGQSSSDTYQHWLTGLADGIHQLRVEASDEYGNLSEQNLTFNVDGSPPLINISGVSPGGSYNSSVQAEISITDLNLNDSQIILDGVPYISGSTISSEGSHTLMVNATDLAGNSTIQRVSFNIDLTAPDVVISFPENNSETNQESTVIVGTTEFGAQVTLTIGSYTDTVFADFEGSFNFSDVPLTGGPNTLNLFATDAAGNAGIPTDVTVNFVNDIIVSGFLTAQSTYGIGTQMSVEWQISNLSTSDVPALPVELNLYRTKDNSLLLTDARNVSLSASETVGLNSVFNSEDLNIGDYRIELRVLIDQTWQVLDVDLVRLVDEVGPTITVLEPVDSQVTQGTVTFLTIAEDAHSEVEGVSYQIDSQTIWSPMAFNGVAYEVEPKVSDGRHEVIFKAEDIFGNETLTPVKVFYVDTMAPDIMINSPMDGLITNQTVVIDYVVTDEHGFSAEASINQQTISNGATIDTEGTYEFTVIAVDEVNNQNEVTRNFIVDKTAPDLEVTSPIEGIQNTTGILDITGLSEARNIITINLNGIETTLKTNQLGEFIAANQSLVVGMNTLVVTATDQAGNVSDPVIINFEYTQVGSVLGRVWQDDDQDTIIDDNELGFNQVSLRLTDSNQHSRELMTDALGYYQFSGVLPGVYTIEITASELLNNWSNTTNNNVLSVVVEVDQSTRVDFGYYQDKPLIQSSAQANNIKGRLLVLLDSPTAQVDFAKCDGVAAYKMQHFIENDLTAGASIWAKLYNDQGVLLQTELADTEDFVTNNYQFIDQQPQTDEFNLILNPVINNHIQATVKYSSEASSPIISADYRLELGIQSATQSSSWSSDVISPGCETFDLIGDVSGELKFAQVELYPTLPSDDPNSSSEAPQLSAQRVVLENILANDGWSYEVTTDAAAFNSLMSSNEFVAYWLLAENIVLTPQSQSNLINNVNNGAGLLVSSGHDNLSSQFYSSMGIQVNGSYINAEELELISSPVSQDQILNVSLNEQVVKVSLIESESAGIFNGDKINPPENQALTWLNRQMTASGVEGNSIFAAIDLLLQATHLIEPKQYSDLIKNILEFMHPLGLSNELGYARSIQLNLQNLGRQIDGYVQVLLPPSVTLVNSPVPIELNQDGFVFDFNLLEDQLLELEFWVKVEDSPVIVTFEVYSEGSESLADSTDLIILAGERPDISALMTNCQAGVNTEQNLSYRYDVTNTGNKHIFGAVATTEFDVGLINPSWTCVGNNGGKCGQAEGTGDLSSQLIEELPVGSSVTYLFETQINTPLVTAVTTSGMVLMPDEVFDINPDDNSAVDYDEVFKFIYRNGFECVAPGEAVSNAGDSNLSMDGE